MNCNKIYQNLESMNIITYNKLNTFNVTFTILAIFIAALGLLYNSTEAILGSMIVSAIINPLIAFIVLFMLGEYGLSFLKLGHFSFLLIISIIISVFVSYINQYFKIFRTPTYEMEARIKISHVITDIMLALLSGFGLGIAIINNDIATKIGFAIILSITPPIVNFGLFTGEALYKYLHEPNNKTNIKQREKLFENGIRSLMLSGLNIIAMFITLFLTLIVVCKNK